MASLWISIAAIGYLSMSVVQVFTQGFNTSGATLAPMIITLVTMWAVEIPLAYSLSFFTPMRELGVAWAIACTSSTLPHLSPEPCRNRIGVERVVLAWVRRSKAVSFGPAALR